MSKHNPFFLSLALVRVFCDSKGKVIKKGLFSLPHSICSLPTLPQIKGSLFYSVLNISLLSFHIRVRSVWYSPACVCLTSSTALCSSPIHIAKRDSDLHKINYTNRTSMENAKLCSMFCENCTFHFFED